MQNAFQYSGALPTKYANCIEIQTLKKAHTTGRGVCTCKYFLKHQNFDFQTFVTHT